MHMRGLGFNPERDREKEREGEREGSVALYFMSGQGEPTVLANLLPVFIVNECPQGYMARGSNSSWKGGSEGKSPSAQA